MDFFMLCFLLSCWRERLARAFVNLFKNLTACRGGVYPCPFELNLDAGGDKPRPYELNILHKIFQQLRPVFARTFGVELHAIKVFARNRRRKIHAIVAGRNSILIW